MKYLTCIALIFIFGSSCNNPSADEVSGFHLDSKIIIDSEDLAMPRKIISFKDLLLIKNNSKVNPLFDTYDLNTGSKLNSFGKKGRGPGEVVSVGTVRFSSELDKLIIYEPVKSSFLYVDSEELHSSNPVIKEYIDIELDGFFANSFCFIDSCFVIQGASRDNNRLQFHPLDSATSYRMGSYNADVLLGNTNVISQFRRELSIQGIIVANPRKHRLASVYYYSDLIEIFDINQNEIISKSEIVYPILKSYTGNNPNDIARISRDAIIGYYDMCIVNDLIYCLFSAESVDSVIKSGNRSHTNIIHVYNWDAKLVAKLKLDKSVQCITYNEERNIIIGIRAKPEPQVLEFKNPVL